MVPQARSGAVVPRISRLRGRALPGKPGCHLSQLTDTLCQASYKLQRLHCTIGKIGETAAMWANVKADKLLVAKELLQELKVQEQCLHDAHMALGLILADSGQQCALGTENIEQQQLLLQELLLMQQLLQEVLLKQIAPLEAYVASLENNRASLLLAESLAARESWDLRVAQHDRLFARNLSACSTEEWEKQEVDYQQQWQQQRQPSSGRAGKVPCSIAYDFMCILFFLLVCAFDFALSGWKAPRRKCQENSSNEDATDAKGKRPIGGRAASDERLLHCAICLESHAQSSMVSAALPQQMASSSSAGGRCGHYFCRDCMRHYACEQVQARKYSLCCPSPSCKECLAYEDVVQLLQGQAELQKYEMLVTEHSIDSSRRTYCPVKDCSCLLERPDNEDEAAAGGQDFPFECPACHRCFCLSCGVTGWHTGMTCAQFQALPPELRSIEDAAMLRMAQQQAWKRCPAAGCGHVVERTEGCNHMRCRCGVDFCYACGSAYSSSQPSADNVHGIPGCSCPLFPHM